MRPDHLRKIEELRVEITRLEAGKATHDEVIKYLVETGEALIVAARMLIEMRLSKKKEKIPVEELWSK